MFHYLKTSYDIILGIFMCLKKLINIITFFCEAVLSKSRKMASEVKPKPKGILKASSSFDKPELHQ